jgi:molybdopterin molybdotransferase
MGREQIAVEEAWRRIETAIEPLPAEKVRLEHASGRVIASPVHTDREYPPFDRAAMDGFAVRSVDVAAAAGSPIGLEVVGESTPGRPFTGHPRPGTAVRIMTGAPVPAGWDSVVPVESTSGFASGPVQVRASSRPGENIVRRGVERASGEALFEPGHRLSVADIGILAMVGASELHVTRRPRVAVLSTGNELVRFDAAPNAVQIRDSNGPMLATLAAAEAEVTSATTAPDEPGALAAAIEAGLAADLFLTSGGVSAGAYDQVGSTLATAGVRSHFERVALQPGAPTLFGTHASGAVLALPGNPVSALVTFRLFALPALRRLQGEPDVRPRWERAEARFAWERRSAKCILFPGRRVAGGAAVERVPYAGSGDLLAYARADCHIVLPPEVPAIRPGDSVHVWPL